MKKILITGSNSYIGNSLETWLGEKTDSYSIDVISLRNDLWKERDFSAYDVVYHVAGIAHQKETKKNRALYYKVNRDLAFKVAKKAKIEGVEQFILLSSMSIYGIDNGVIYRNTSINPKTNYSKSKFEAEQLIRPLGDGQFNIAILRPPMIYGKGCKGNYSRLTRLALRTPIFPKVDNKRSMLYIDNLSEFVKQLIDESRSGIFFPQNEEYVCTAEMVKQIAKTHNKNVKFTKVINPILKLLSFKFDIVNKVFGDLTYEKNISESIDDYQVMDLKESILATELERR
ncbi:NAD-dependent epimerase/dehydratase family protein [Paraliobacillus sediminis]|uniref:NAD-dependent epimerase/dehydratase family protein n=1 Tax=Paraliobacillus sediminis TaxID=1885916 RepID=UPI000E3C37AA|nr:NAD-dependent epimerase/dehydratase family protein [Paraliobacillus sediminis]